ncbi:MAG: hypothetical protein WBP93_18005 [Pyrinomonadaceae bacterium]
MSIKFKIALLLLGLLSSSLGLLWVLTMDAAPPPVTDRRIPEPQVRKSQIPQPQIPEAHNPTPETILPSVGFDLESIGKAIPEPKCQGEVAGEVPTLAGYKRSLKSTIFNQKMPEVRLVFHRDSNKCDWPLNTSSGESPNVDVKLSRAARRLLRSLWAKACVYYYYEMFEKQDLDTRKSRYVAMNIARVNTANELDGLFINAPGKRRNFSEDERFALTWHIVNAAQNVVKQAYETQKRNVPTA